MSLTVLTVTQQLPKDMPLFFSDDSMGGEVTPSEEADRPQAYGTNQACESRVPQIKLTHVNVAP